MAEMRSKSKLPEPGRWSRRLKIAGVAFAVLLLVLYFIVTSGAFVKGVIVPQAGAALNADISVSSAQVSPFSKVVLRDLKITPEGRETLLSANEINARYSLWSLIRGKIAVDDVTVIAPIITVVENADGTRNLGALMKSQQAKPEEKSPPTTSDKPLDVDIKSVHVKNATLRYVKNQRDGRSSMELASVNLTLGGVRNGGAGKLDLSAALVVDKKAPEASKSAALQALLNAGFAFELTQDLKPGAVKGNASFSIGQATGTLADLNALAAKLDCETSPTEVKQFALRFSRANAPLGELRVSGPFNPEKIEGKLKAEILAIDRQVLNLVGAASGMDFGTTTINSASDIALANGGQQISVVGQLNVEQFQVKKQNETTPTLDLRCDYSVAVDQGAKSALLKTLNLAGTQGGRPLLQTELTSPMPIGWGVASTAVGDSALNLTLSNLNLADWQAFATDLAPQGIVNARAKLLSQQGGKHLGFDLDGKVENVSARLGSNALNRVDLRAFAKGSAVDLKQFKLDDCRLDLAQQGQSAVTASASGTFDSATQDADLQFAVTALLTRLLAVLPQPDVNITAGALDFKGKITSKDKNQAVTGQLVLTDLSGRFAENRFTSFGLGLDLDVGMKREQVEVRKAAGEVREGQKIGGKLEATGNYDLGRKAGQFALKVADFNENGLRPFLESALGEKKLVSVSLSTTASASLEANGEAAIKADAQVSNLVVKDPAGSLPSTPLEARVQVDSGVAKNVAQIRQCSLTLTPTERAKNELGLTGMVDFSKSNAITGYLKLSAESLDVTRYYDLFAGPSKPTDAKPDETKPAPASKTTPAPADKEPDPVKLPLQNFTFEASIGRFYLREVDIANLQATTKLDGGHVLLNPFQLTLNGAPVNATADLDLGVPGYKYDVAFSANTIPAAPLVNTFIPDRKGQISGTTTASAQIKGAGVTGTSLQTNLTGSFGLVLTNMNLSVDNVRNPIIHSIVNVIIGIPELIRNPAASLGNLVKGLAGQRSGWADPLTVAPIEVIHVNGKAGQGQVTLEQAEVRSAAFQALASGNIKLAPILTNSTIQIPVRVLLSRAMGEKIGLVTSDTPTNAVYVPMPQFLTMKGTLGKPDTDINKVALFALAAKGGSGVVKGIGGATGEKIGGALEAVGSLLGGGKSATSTNQPSATSTNQQPGLLDLFRRQKKQ
jgi:uncharacterized protein involved in outer membrane biogenesis